MLFSPFPPKTASVPRTRPQPIFPSARSPGRIGERLGRLPLHAFVPGNHYLRYPLAWFYLERRIGEVHKNDLDFPPVIGINRPRRIEHRHPVFRRQPAARTHLHLIARRQLDEKSRRDKRPAQGSQHDTLRNVGPHIHSGRKGRFIIRQFVCRPVYNFNDHSPVILCRRTIIVHGG